MFNSMFQCHRMPRKSDLSIEEKDSTKKRSTNGNCSDKQGVILIDLDGKRWKLGRVLGIGGFGEIYEATDISIREKNQYFVAKLEKHSKGPLFVEVNCYLRIAKSQMSKYIHFSNIFDNDFVQELITSPILY